MMYKKVKHVSDWTLGQNYYLANVGDVLSIYSVDAAPLIAAGVVVEATDAEIESGFNVKPDWTSRANPFGAFDGGNQFSLNI